METAVSSLAMFPGIDCAHATIGRKFGGRTPSSVCLFFRPPSGELDSRVWVRSSSRGCFSRNAYARRCSNDFFVGLPNLPLERNRVLTSLGALGRRRGRKKSDTGSDSEYPSGEESSDENAGPKTSSSSASYSRESELEYDDDDDDDDDDEEDDEEDEDWDDSEKIEPATLHATNAKLKEYWEAQEGVPGYPLVEKDQLPPDASTLGEEDLWWTWRDPKPGNEDWSAWQKRLGNADAAMAAAAAEMKQIKLYGDYPSVAETTLARTRRKVLSDERLAMEKKLREEMGDMAYYKQWVEGYKGPTDKEEVARIAKEKNESKGYQIAELFSHLSEREVRLLMSTDARLERDPLCYRMTPKQIQEVWGGDPVYPSINYVQEMNKRIDYRGPNFHEPRDDILDVLEKEGRIITKEQIEEIEKQEAAEEYESLLTFDEMDEAIDIGDKDDDIDEDDDIMELADFPEKD